MKKWMRNLAIMLVVALSVAFVSGCGQKELDAEAAVDAYLRAETRGDVEDYAELLGKDKTELEEEYAEQIDELMEMFSEMDILGEDFSEDLLPVVKEMLATTKYEVVGSEKDEDGNYTVDVDVYPSDVFALYMSNVMEAVQSIDINSDYGKVLVEALQDAIDAQSYGDAETYQVRIEYDEEEKSYEINEEDVTALAGAFFELEDMMDLMYSSSGTVYDNPYLNWTKTEWDAASEDEKTQCCLALIQEMYGFTDEEIATLDLSDATVQDSIEMMKEGLDLTFSASSNISVGDYANMIAGQMGIE